MSLTSLIGIGVAVSAAIGLPNSVIQDPFESSIHSKADSSLMATTEQPDDVIEVEGCDYRMGVAMTGGAWAMSVDGCGFIGTSDTSTWQYSWFIDTATYNSSDACVTGRGYIKSGTSYQPNWVGLGCGGQGGGAVRIGNVASVAKNQFRVFPTAALIPAMIQWK